MALLSRSIPNLFNGVSQQPPQLRHSSQCELQVNGYSSIATGLRKRPPTEHVARLMDVPEDEPAVHYINRDQFERYIVLATGDDIRVWDLDGNERPVEKPEGLDYMSTTSPREDFSMVTGADHTFVLNKRAIPALGGGDVAENNIPFCSTTFTNYPLPSDKYSWVEYRMYVNGTMVRCFVTRTHNFPVGTAEPRKLSFSQAIQNMASQLRSKFRDWTVRVHDGRTIAVYAPTEDTPIPSVDAKVYVRYGSSDYHTHHYSTNGKTSGVGALSGTVQRFSDLPTSGVTKGAVWRVGGDPSNSFDDYWVEWDGSAWVEATQPGLAATISAATMPHVLVREATGDFVFRPAEWDPRRVGDPQSNPNPSFIGRQVRDIFFYRNRLGMLADETVCMSRAGEYYNYWIETVTSEFDSDPIDTSASGSRVSILNHAVPFNKDLMLFSEQTQFRMTGGDVLRPSTVRIDTTTEFEASPHCRPAAAGPTLFFPVERGGWTGIREYYVEEDTTSDDAADITAHVPSYIPENVFRIATCTSEDVLGVLTLAERNALYVYKYYWSGTDKVQSSWSKFEFDPDCVILGVEFYGTVAYFVVKRSDGVFLEKMDLQSNKTDEGLRFLVHLDRRCELVGEYDSTNNWTTWTLPYETNEDVQVVLSGDFEGQRGSMVAVTRPSPTTVRAPGRYDQAAAYVGVSYTFRYRFSELYVKDEKDVAVSGGVLKLRRMSVNYDDTCYFRAEVTPKARETYTYPFTGKVLGSINFVIGRVPVESGTFTFPIQTSNLGVKIDLVNDSPYPSNFQSAEWVGEFTLKAAR